MILQQLKNVLQQHGISDEQWLSANNDPERVVKIETEKGNYWLKKAAPARGIFRYYGLNLFSKLLRLPLLKAVPQPGGEAAISNELNRITHLKANHIAVPAVISHDKQWLLIEDAGVSIIKELKSKSVTQQRRQELFAMCLSAIKEVHRKSQYLSQGFVRNMVLNPHTQEVVFIDFEDDPLEVMSLPDAQARDLLLFVESTARFFIEDQGFFQQQVHNFLDAHEPKMVSSLKQTVERLQWVTKMPFQKWLGHDYDKLKISIMAMSGLD